MFWVPSGHTSNGQPLYDNVFGIQVIVIPYDTNKLIRRKKYLSVGRRNLISSTVALASGGPLLSIGQPLVMEHKTANVLNKVPKTLQPTVKAASHEIWMSDGRDNAEKALLLCVKNYEARYPKAMDFLLKNQESLLVFDDFPAEHWSHIRTTNPIESVFATVRLRTTKTKNCGSRKATLATAFKLMGNAQKRWHKLCGYKNLAGVIEGIKLTNGIQAEQNAA